MQPATSHVKVWDGLPAGARALARVLPHFHPCDVLGLGRHLADKRDKNLITPTPVYSRLQIPPTGHQLPFDTKKHVWRGADFDEGPQCSTLCNHPLQPTHVLWYYFNSFYELMCASIWSRTGLSVGLISVKMKSNSRHIRPLEAG